MAGRPRKTPNPDELFANSESETTSLTLDLDTAFLTILLMANAADGELAEEEKEALSATLKRMQLFKSRSAKQREQLFNQSITIFNEHNSCDIFAAAKKALPPKLRETAFAAAADLVFSDGVITEEEGVFLGRMWKALAISDATGKKILDVMEIFHRG